MDKFVDLSDEIKKSEDAKKKTNLAFEKDRNESSALMNNLYKERGVLRQKHEESLERVEDLKDQLISLNPKKKGMEDTVAKKTEDLRGIREELSKTNQPLEELKGQSIPLLEREKEIRAQMEELKLSVDEQGKKISTKEADLAALKARRKVLSDSFDQRKDTLMEEIRRPVHLYYGDEVEVEVSSVAPSGRGIFLDYGYLDGMREKMTFLTSVVDGEISRKPVLMQSTLVQDRLAFLEYVEDLNSDSQNLIESGEKLFLIRTGDSNTTR